MKFKLIETIINEDIATVKAMYPDMDDKVFNALLCTDPTYKEGSNSVGKFGKWILNQYKKGNVEVKKDNFGITPYYVDDNDPNIKYPFLFNLLDNYNIALKEKNIEKDINRFKTPMELSNAISNAEDSEKTKRQKERFEKNAKSETTLVFSGDGFDIYTPKSYAGSVYIGKGTNWCTAAQSHDGKMQYASYTGDTRHLTDDEKEEYIDEWKRYDSGQLFVLISKNNPREKYQFYFEQQQFMDKADEEINIYEFFDNHYSIYEFFLRLNDANHYRWDNFFANSSDYMSLSANNFCWDLGSEDWISWDMYEYVKELTISDEYEPQASDSKNIVGGENLILDNDVLDFPNVEILNVDERFILTPLAIQYLKKLNLVRCFKGSRAEECVKEYNESSNGDTNIEIEYITRL